MPTDERQKQEGPQYTVDSTGSNDENRHVTVEATFIPIGNEWQLQQHLEQQQQQLQAQQQRRQRSLAASSSGRRTIMQLPPGVIPGPPG